MKYYKCDKCGNERLGELEIELNGYSRPQDGGILLPGGRQKHFCSIKCFLTWMKEALTEEDEDE